MKTCAIYARVSDESQAKGDSIEHQISFSREFAKLRSDEEGIPWLTPDSLVFVDEGITGTSMVKRPSVLRLIQAARQRNFDIILFKGISRFARDTVDALLMLRTLMACNVRVISMEENFDSERDRAEFVFTIHSALAQAESEKTAIRVRIGAMEKAKDGKWNGRSPDGYVLNPQTKRLEVDEAVAPIVRRIFELYLTGNGCRKIVEKLNSEGQYTKQGNLWTQRNIARLLQNPVYVGDVVYGRRKQRQAMPDEHDFFQRKKITVKEEDTRHIIVCRDAHPAIIGRDMFDQVARLMEKRRTEPGRSGDVHLLSKGLLRCVCGSSMTVKQNGRGRRYYRCVGQSDKGNAFCGQRYVRADDIESAVLLQIRVDVEHLLQQNQIEFPPTREENIEDQRNRLEKEIERQLAKSCLLFDKYSDGLIGEEQFARMNRSICQRVETLQRILIDGFQEEPASRWQSNDVSQTVHSTLRELLSLHSPDKRMTRRVLETLVHKVCILRSSEDCVDLAIQYKYRLT